MSNKDYTKFSNPRFDNRAKENIANKVEPVKPEVEVVEVSEPEVEAVEQKTKKGVVTNCLKLNGRKFPSPNSEVLCIIDAQTDVEVNEEESTECFYKVRTSTGAEVYCAKRFIDLLP